mgnify:CR=1 FL=1
MSTAKSKATFCAFIFNGKVGEISDYLSKIGTKEGDANSSASQSVKGKSAWDKLSKAERSPIAKERAKKRGKIGGKHGWRLVQAAAD